MAVSTEEQSAVTTTHTFPNTHSPGQDVANPEPMQHIFYLNDPKRPISHTIMAQYLCLMT